MNEKVSEIRAIIILFVITLAVCITGYLLYKNLSSISEKVSESYNYELSSSQVVRQILIELGNVENNVTSYNLDNKEEYLTSFYKSISSVEQKMILLKGKRKINEKEKIIIDSILTISETKFELFKKQLYLGDQNKIIDELNIISQKINASSNQKKELQPTKSEKDKTPTLEESQLVEKESFFKRLFGKKKKTIDTAISNTIAEKEKIASLKNSIIATNDLKNTVQKAKENQLEKLQERQKKELNIINEGKLLLDKIIQLNNELEQIEQQASIQKIEAANKKVNTIKQLVIIVSISISILLLIVTLYIISYARKKKEYEAILLTAKENAEDLVKTKEIFLANMSHEIKTPLNAIYGFTEQVLNTNLNTQQKEQLGIVKKSADHLIKLITNILNYSKIQAGKDVIHVIDFDLKKELYEIECIFKKQTDEKKINLYFEIENNLPTAIRSDYTKLKQILFNLIGNAIKFTETGFVKVTARKVDNTIKINIIDSGIGIAQDKIPKLFNEYQQADSSISKKYGGTGLGLVITKKLVEQLSGTINLTSEEGKGTVVNIKIPYIEPKNTNISDSEKVESIIEGEILQFKKILVVDDEEFNRLLLKTILSKYNVEVAEAKNGAEAVDATKSKNYDLILMDVHMPVKSGIDACIEIKKKNPNLLILATTAAVNKEKLKEYENAGFNGYINKPFTENYLIKNLIKTLKEEQTSNQEHPQKNIPIKKNNSTINIENINSIANGDETFKKEIISIFHKSINEGASEIEALCKEKKWLQVADVAHKIMAPCKHFDAEKLYSILTFFENLREVTPEQNDLKNQLNNLKSEIELANSELKLYL